MAARGHDVAALSIKGARAVLNFQDLARHLLRPASLAPRDVQATAARATLMHSTAGGGSSSSSSRDAPADDDDDGRRAGAAAHEEPEPEPQPERQPAQAVEVAAELVFDELAPLWVESSGRPITRGRGCRAMSSTQSSASTLSVSYGTTNCY